MANELAPVYLDDARVQLQGDPRPKVAKIVAAGGKSAAHLRIERLGAVGDESGQPMQLDDVIDRAQQRAPVYLRSIPQGDDAPGLEPESGTFRADEATGVGTSESSGSVTQQGSASIGRGASDDPTSSIGNRARPGTQFGAGRPGMAGQGAQGSKGDLPLDKQAKSDFDPDQRDARNGASNQTFGVGDLAPGGRTSLTDKPNQPSAPGPRLGADRAILDGTQEFQSGGRQGEGGAPPYRDADVGSRGVDVEGGEGIGAAERRQAGPRPALGSKDPAQGAQGAAIRDQSTDHTGRQQGQRPKRPTQSSGSGGSAGKDAPQAAD